MPAYAAALLLPPTVAFGSAMLYTRALAPAEYGHLALVLAISTVVIGLCARYLTVGITRLYPGAARDGLAADFLVTIIGVWAVNVVLCLCLLPVFQVAFPAASGASRSDLGLTACALIAARTFVVCANSIRRAQLRIWQFAIMECTQALAGLAGTLIVTSWFGWNAGTVLGGTAAGYAVSAAICACVMCPELRGGRFNRGVCKNLFVFVGPLTLTYGLALLLASADQFFAQAMLGAAAGGLYGAVTGLANRSIVLVFSGISMLMFPLSVRALEHQGQLACQQQERQGLELLFAAALPTAAFLIFAAPHAVQVLLGPDYRAAALSLLPWIVVATFINRMAVDVFDHAFYLAQRTGLLFATLVPATIVSIACNLVLLPRFGILGAALAKIAEAAVMLALSAGIGSLKIRMPMAAILRTALATAVMLAALALCSVPQNAFGLAIMLGVAGMVYGICALTLDLAGVRRFLSQHAGVQAA
jgi:O-antigen/teichoic acid export membrane protein